MRPRRWTAHGLLAVLLSRLLFTSEGNRFNIHSFSTLRGGSVEGEREGEGVEEEENSSLKQPLSGLLSIFRLNADIKEEAANPVFDEDDDESFSTMLELAPNTGSNRGGALAITQKPKGSRAHRMFGGSKEKVGTTNPDSQDTDNDVALSSQNSTASDEDQESDDTKEVAAGWWGNVFAHRSLTADSADAPALEIPPADELEDDVDISPMGGDEDVAKVEIGSPTKDESVVMKEAESSVASLEDSEHETEVRTRLVESEDDEAIPSLFAGKDIDDEIEVPQKDELVAEEDTSHKANEIDEIESGEGVGDLDSKGTDESAALLEEKKDDTDALQSLTEEESQSSPILSPPAMEEPLSLAESLPPPLPDLRARYDASGERVRKRISKERKLHKKIQSSTTQESIPAQIPVLEGGTERPREVSEELASESEYVSSGAWVAIDNVVSLGLSNFHPMYKPSRHLRGVRKAAAKATGLHGVLSGKRVAARPRPAIRAPPSAPKSFSDDLDDEDVSRIQRRIAAIDRARQNVERSAEEEARLKDQRKGLFGGLFRRGKVKADALKDELSEEEQARLRLRREEEEDRARRHARVKEIDGLIQQGQARLNELSCEKDALQKRPNPLYNYTATEELKEDDEVKYMHGRTFNFPEDDLVDEYLSELFAHGRLTKMNHTFLWRNDPGYDDDDEEEIGDDLLTPSADARKLYEERRPRRNGNRSEQPRNGNGGGGSWLLRQSLGRKTKLGEKIGEAAETAAYKAICHALMSSLARALSSLHGINIMTHSDIRIFVESSPDLPPVGKDVLPGSRKGSNYAQQALIGAMKHGSKRKKKKSHTPKSSMLAQDAFIQRDAVVETLISHCQISAPLLKLFPLAWQRALLGNIITLITAVVSDFCDGIQLQILGHALSFSFKPITESDMIRHIGLAGGGFNHRRARPEQFEAAVRQTAEDVSDSLNFLDRWHERALGSGHLRAQIANLIARIVLTLADEVLSGARMDLWSAQAGGPRLVAGLEYRTKPTPL